MVQRKAFGAVVMVAMAWMLWSSHMVIPGFVEPSWHALDGYETENECYKNMPRITKWLAEGEKRHFKKVEKLGYTFRNFEVSKNTYHYDFYVRGKFNSTNSYIFKCYPSDFDPRARK